MNGIYFAIVIMIVLFIIIIIIKDRKDIKKEIVNIFVAIIAGVAVLVINNLLGIDVNLINIFPTSTPTIIPVTPSPLPSPSESPTPTFEPLTNYNAQAFMKNFLLDMTVAVNTQNFNKVEKYLKEDSNAYTEQKKYILNYSQENNDKKELKRVEILYFNAINKYTAIIDTYETYGISSPQKKYKVSEFSAKYTVNYVGGSWKISEIIKK